jgi:hypothetical protein
MLPLFGGDGPDASGSPDVPAGPAGQDQDSRRRAASVPPRDGHRIADAVLASSTFRGQDAMTRGRGTLERSKLHALLTALVGAPGHRLTGRQAADALGDHPLSVRRVVMSAARLLNVEGYPVIGLDADGTTVVLDVDLLTEQFGLRMSADR